MQAAAHGGYTTVLTMPNTKPVADNPDIVNYVHNKAKSGSCIHVLQVGAVTKGQQGKELADIEGMVKAGSPAISEDGKSVMDAVTALATSAGCTTRTATMWGALPPTACGRKASTFPKQKQSPEIWSFSKEPTTPPA